MTAPRLTLREFEALAALTRWYVYGRIFAGRPPAWAAELFPRPVGESDAWRELAARRLEADALGAFNALGRHGFAELLGKLEDLRQARPDAVALDLFDVSPAPGPAPAEIGRDGGS